MRNRLFQIMVSVTVFTVIVGLTTDNAYAWKGKGGGGSSGPVYYKYEDLKQASKNYRGHFHFENYSKPANAAASLPYRVANYSPIWVTSQSSSAIRPSSSQFLSVPWGDSRINKGQIASIRGGDASSAVLAWFTSWTHDAIVWDRGNLVLEAMPPNDSRINSARETWRNIVTYSFKNVASYDGNYAVSSAYWKYINKPYYPQVSKDSAGLLDFFRKWSDKDDTSSYYCSKLVWRLFMDFGVDLDSNRTSSTLGGHYLSKGMDFGSHNWNAWIGVSPDDIYYSQHMGPDIIIAGAENLNAPLLESIF